MAESHPGFSDQCEFFTGTIPGKTRGAGCSGCFSGIRAAGSGFDLGDHRIDRLFVSGLQEDTYNYRLISNVIDFARRKDIRICCEGVENDQERSVLEGLSPDLMQGYLFARPCAREEFEETFIHTGVGDRD